MSTATSPHAIDRQEDLALLRTMWEDVKNELVRRKRSIDQEIRTYPTPIPRCDAQFNHLYEQQARLARELDRLSALAEKTLAYRDYIRLIGEFVASAPFTDDAAERELKSRLKTKLAAVEK